MDDELQPRLGRVLRAARLRAGLTQAQVARAVGSVSEVYGHIERGEALPSIQRLRRLCVTLNLTSDALLSLETSPASSQEQPLARPEEPPELQRIVSVLRLWTPERLRVLLRILKVFESTPRT